MGNCQAAETAAAVIQHPGPGNKMERLYWSVRAHQVMNSNPGHYVALIVDSHNLKSENGTSLKQLKLLRPEDTLLIGHVYRLITFEDVLKEFAAKKCIKLGKLLEVSGSHEMQMRVKESGPPNPTTPSNSEDSSSAIKCQVEQRLNGPGSNGGSSSRRRMNKAVGRNYGGGHWRPALESIAETGT